LTPLKIAYEEDQEDDWEEEDGTEETKGGHLNNPMIHKTSAINASTLFSLRYAFCQLTKVEGTSSVILSRGDTSGTTT
jgi:hypothetical protein